MLCVISCLSKSIKVCDIYRVGGGGGLRMMLSVQK